ncbi:MAG: efflux RND transporter periplasmic adaptor subunit [Rubripirellula sp.]
MTLLSILIFKKLRSRYTIDPCVVRTLLVFAMVLASSMEPQSEDTIGTGIELQDCTVRFAKEVKVPALESGPVATVDVRVNDPVKSGDPLARLDDGLLLIQRRAAQERQRLAKERADDEDQIEYAETVLDQAQAEYDAKRSVYNEAPGAVPFFEVRKLRLAVKLGELEIKQAEKRKRSSGVEMELRQAELSLVDAQLRQLHIESPLDGVVLEVMHSEGEWIQKGEPLATIGQIDRLHVRALLRTDLIAAQDCLSLPVSVHWVDPSSGKSLSLRGKVLSVDPQVISGGQYVRLHAEIENRQTTSGTQWQLRPGTDVRMQIYPHVASTARQTSNANRR